MEETVVYLTEDSELALGKSHLSLVFLFFYTFHFLIGGLFIGIGDLLFLLQNITR